MYCFLPVITTIIRVVSIVHNVVYTQPNIDVDFIQITMVICVILIEVIPNINKIRQRIHHFNFKRAHIVIFLMFFIVLYNSFN